MRNDISERAGGGDNVAKPGLNMSIQGMRGFAALLVAISHIYAMSLTTGIIKPESRATILGTVGNFGHFGVVLFFFISGYLIVQTLTKHKDVKKFMINRAIRIYPAFIALSIPIFLLGPLANYEWMGSLRGHPIEFLKALIENLLFLPGMFALPIAQKNAWSLSYEFAFYLIACAFYLAFSRMRKASPQQFLAVAATVAITVLAIWKHNLAGCFLVGVLIFYAEPLWANGNRRFVNIAGSLSVILLLTCYASFGVVPVVFEVLGALLFATIVAETGTVSRAFRLPFFQFLGKISYSLYLIHPFVYVPIRSLLGKAHHHGVDGNILLLVFYVIGLPAAIMAGTISYTLIEDRFTRRFLKRRAAPRQPVPEYTVV